MSLSEALPVHLEGRQVLRREKDEDRLPERMVERTAVESIFHREGPMAAMGQRMRSEIYLGAIP